MKVDLDMRRRAVITTLLRREALRLRAIGQSDATADAHDLASYADELEQWPEEPEPARVNAFRDLAV